MKISIEIGREGSQDCSLILRHEKDFWEFLIDSEGWKLLAYVYKLGEQEISLKEFHTILKWWRSLERADDIAEASE